MTHPPGDPREALIALCDRGVDWHRDLPPLVIPSARPAAVLVLFGALDHIPADESVPWQVRTRVPSDLDVLLLRRAATLRSHPGQIAFPGGRIDEADAGPVEAALREAVEETGLDPVGIEPLGVLPALPLAVSNHIVTPVAAWWKSPSTVAAVDHDETVEVFRVPVAELLDPANRATTAFLSRSLPYNPPAFTVGDKLIWGFTAIVLSRMFDELGWAVPWDSSRTVTPQL